MGDPNKYTSELFKNYDDKKSNKGYLLEADIEYPKHLHKPHNELPFLAQRRKPLNKLFKHEISDDIKEAHNKIIKQFNLTHEPENKLIATIQDKEKYVVNISTLKQALDHGLILTKVHRYINTLIVHSTLILTRVRINQIG